MASRSTRVAGTPVASVINNHLKKRTAPFPPPTITDSPYTPLLDRTEDEEELMADTNGSSSSAACPMRQPQFDTVAEQATVASIADLRQMLREDFAPLTMSIDSTRQDLKAINERWSKIEDRIDITVMRVEKLEQFMDTSSADTAAINKKMCILEEKLTKLTMSEPIMHNASPPMDSRSQTAVLGGLEALGSQATAVSWLHGKLLSLSGPAPKLTYIKSDAFQGILFATFDTQLDRDTAVSLLRSAGLQQGIWASPDRPPPVRSARKFLFGAKRILKEKFHSPYAIRVDEDLLTMTVGGELAIEIKVTGHEVDYKWADEWLNWAEFQNSPDIKQLKAEAEAILTRASQGLKGHAKGSTKGKTLG